MADMRQIEQSRYLEEGSRERSVASIASRGSPKKAGAQGRA